MKYTPCNAFVLLIEKRIFEAKTNKKKNYHKRLKLKQSCLELFEN